MNYCKVSGGVATKYTLNQLKRDNPDISFPQKLFDGSVDPTTLANKLARFQIEPYTVPALPSYDEKLEHVVEGAILKNTGKWVQKWIVVPLTTAELNRLTAEKTIDQVRSDNTLKALLRMGPEGIESYIDSNSTSLASSNAIMKKLATLIWLLAQDQMND